MPIDSKSANLLTLTIPTDVAVQRLDAYLAQALLTEHEGLTRTRIQSLIEEGQILVNNAKAKSSLKVRGGENITIIAPLDSAPLTAKAENIPLDVVHEDPDLAVINKPAGMMVHAGSGLNDKARSEGTLVNALLHRFKKLSTIGGELRPGIVHRLDKETSGLIIIAKNDKAHEKLAAMFSNREVKKTYVALVQGHVKHDNGTINTSIGRDTQRRTRMTTKPDENARTAITHYQVLERLDTRFGKFTFIEVRIETGRTHQIRVHMSSLLHPVVGDKLYGAAGRHVEQTTGTRLNKVLDSITLDRNFLHAAQLEFKHPKTGKLLKLSAPLPSELESYLTRLKSSVK